jgi:hypothetical protein
MRRRAAGIGTRGLSSGPAVPGRHRRRAPRAGKPDRTADPCWSAPRLGWHRRQMPSIPFFELTAVNIADRAAT